MTPSVLLGVSLKMYFDHRRTLAWTREIVEHSAASDRVEVVLLPSFPSLDAVARIAAPHGVKVGAQNVCWEPAGAFTGEVSGSSLRQIGCEYVEVGHAERRRYFGEDDAVVARKVDAVLRDAMTPILCLGEAERSDDAVEACVRQLEVSLSRVQPDRRGRPIVVAYEPVWAIGRREPAPTDHVRRVAATLREWLGGRWGAGSRVIYGGSAGRGLLREVAGAVDGLFLGRYAHDPATFHEIMREAEAVASERG